MKKNFTYIPKIKTLAFLIATIAIVLIPLSVMPEIVFEKEYTLPPVDMDAQTSEMIHKGDWAGAMKGLTSAFDTDGADPNLRKYIVHGYKALGMTALSERKLGEALENFEQGLYYDNQDPDLLLGLGLSHLMRSDYLDAENALMEAINIEPSSYIARLKLGELYYLQNDTQNAAAYWREALRIRPDDERLKKRLKKLERQMAIRSELSVEADRYFSVAFDGESNPELSYTVMEILRDAYFDIGQSLFLYPKRQIGVTLLTRTAYSDVTESPEWTSGLYEGQIKAPVGEYDPEALRTVLYHEYVHAVIFDAVSNRCPWWLNEGLAQYLSEGSNTKNQKMKLSRLLLEGQTSFHLMQLPGKIANDPALARSSYALALSAVAFFIEEFTIFNLVEALESLSTGKDMNQALLESIGFSLMEFENFWLQTVQNNRS